MANNVYPKALIAFMSGQINLATVNVKVAIIDAADETYNAADQYLSDIAAAGIVAISGNLANKTLGVVAAGVFDADDLTLTGVTGDGTESVVVFVDTGNVATSPVLALLDGTVTPDGGNINVGFSASGIFQI